MSTTNKQLPNNTTSKLVSCMDCHYAMLHRYAKHDPVLAACEAKPQPYNVRFPYQIEVARSMRRCEHYRYTNAQKHIQLRVKRYLSNSDTTVNQAS